MKPEHRPRIFLAVAFITSIYILASGSLLVQSVPVLLTMIFGLLLIVWAILSIKLNKHHEEHHKLPKGYFLVTKGPYEIIRHPIYAGELLLLSGFVQWDPTLLRYIAFVVLFAALLLKMIHEEQVLEEKISGYMPYKKKTHKLIPYLF